MKTLLHRIATLASLAFIALVAFAVGYAAVAWLLKFIAHHGLGIFIRYRVALGTVVLILVGTGALAPT